MKICIVTATRAEYGLLRPLMHAIKHKKEWELQILATGAHLSPEFGLTYREIEKDGYEISTKVEMLLSSDTSEGIVKSMGLGMIGFADAIKNLQPDILIILGDRYEMLSIASAALIFKIPLVHIHGGEITEGAFDDAIRHSITKMAHLHFTSTEEYRNRVIQLGEKPAYVHNVGAIGLENVFGMNLLSKEELEESLEVRFAKYNYQITFHPSTLDNQSPEDQFNILLKAIESQEDSFFVFTKSNADTGGRIINSLIDRFTAQHPEKSIAFTSLGNLRFLSLLKVCDAIVGNSSSGIIEAPSMKTATINIGNRQRGRKQADSVINTLVDLSAINGAFDQVKSPAFKQIVSTVTNPYWNGGSVEKIMSALENITLNDFQYKSFYDLEYDRK